MRRLAILALLWLILAVAAIVLVSCGPEPARYEPVPPSKPMPPSSAYEPGEVTLELPAHGRRRVVFCRQ